MHTLASHRWTLLALGSALFALVAMDRPVGQAATGAARALDATPAGMPLPPLPGIEAADPAVAPAPRALARDAALTDRFTAAGQKVAYPFEMEAGELSLFELHAAGFARGWNMGASLRVLAADGQPLAELESKGGVQLKGLLPFTAPAAGTYTLELGPTEQFFRYALVRHSQYAPRDQAPIDVGERELVHGWVGGEGDRARFSIPVRAGQRLAVSVLATRAEAQAEERRLRSAASADSTMAGMRWAMEDGERKRGSGRLYSELHLFPCGSEAPLESGNGFLLFGPAENDGRQEVAVYVGPGQQGALFDLAVRRDVPLCAVQGSVVDADDEPLEGVTVRLLLEPDLESWGTTRTDSNGAWALNVPPGEYRAELRREGGAQPQVASAALRADSILNLLWRGEEP